MRCNCAQVVNERSTKPDPTCYDTGMYRASYSRKFNPKQHPPVQAQLGPPHLARQAAQIRLDEGVSVIALRITNPLFPAARYCGWTEIYLIYNRQYATLANTVLMELQFTTEHAIIYMHRYIHNNNSHRAILPFYTYTLLASITFTLAHIHSIYKCKYIHVVIVHIPNTSNVYIRSHKITLFIAGLKRFMPTILLQ